jgi:hypothetical protein
MTIACALPACLPAGGPPSGQQVVRDRTLGRVFLSPAETMDTPSYLLATGPVRALPAESYVASGALADLYLFPYAPSLATVPSVASAPPVVRNMVFYWQTRLYANPLSGAIPTDSRGRMVYVDYDPSVPVFGVRRLDPATEIPALLGQVDFSLGYPAFMLSPARTRVLSGSFSFAELWDLDADLHLKTVYSDNVAFIGEDFYFTTDADTIGTSIVRVRTTGEMESLLSSTGNVTFTPILGNRTPQLLLTQTTAAGQAPFALLDTGTLNATNLPVAIGQGQFMSASSDGHWLLFEGSGPGTADTKLLLFDWTTGTYATIDSARVGDTIDASRFYAWRPGRDELWFLTANSGSRVWKSDDTLTAYSWNLVEYPEANAPQFGWDAFSPDGRHFFSRTSAYSKFVYVGQADDANAPTFPLNPAGTSTMRYWAMDDGRLLVEAYPIDARRCDIYLVDADTGSTRALASAGQVVAVGQTRFLALVDWDLQSTSGKLVLVDLASAAQTVLAEDVYDVAVDSGARANVPPGTDALAPGTRVAFLTRNRLESPDDGLWVAELP